MSHGHGRCHEERTSAGALLQETPETSRAIHAEWVNVIEKVVLDMKAEGLNVKLKSMGWHLFEKTNLTLERQ